MEKKEDDDGGNGSMGGKGKEKGKNPIKQEHKEEQKARAQNPPPIIEPPQRDFEDGSVLMYDLTEQHLDLLGKIAEQTEDDCWARVLKKILEYLYNLEHTAVNQRNDLSIKGLLTHVLLGKEDASNGRKLRTVENFAIPSLKKATNYIKDTGLEKDFGRQREIYTLRVLPTAVMAKLQRHVLIIVAWGFTADQRLFFMVQNTWGEGWGVRGYGRIIVAETCPIVFLDRLL